MKTSRIVIIFMFLILLLFSCTPKERYKNIDLKNVEPVKLETHRYEQALFSIDTQYFEQGVKAMAPEFSFILGDDYFLPQKILQLKNFISEKIHQDAWQACRTKYRNIDWIEQELADGFRRYCYFYPETGNIEFYTYISGYNWEYPVHFFDNNTFLVGLDNYLGDDFEVYKKLQIPQYIRKRMDSSLLVSDIFRTLISSKFEWTERPELLIDHIISSGKTLYFLDILLPKTPKEYKIGYTEEQVAFCEENEDQIWQFFVENNILFSSDHKNIRSFISEGPFTSGFPHESPGRIGQWIGWQIVSAYMQNNTDITLQELMRDDDYKKILQESGYKPKK